MPDLYLSGNSTTPSLSFLICRGSRSTGFTTAVRRTKSSSTWTPTSARPTATRKARPTTVTSAAPAIIRFSHSTSSATWSGVARVLATCTAPMAGGTSWLQSWYATRRKGHEDTGRGVSGSREIGPNRAAESSSVAESSSQRARVWGMVPKPSLFGYHRGRIWESPGECRLQAVIGQRSMPSPLNPSIGFEKPTNQVIGPFAIGKA